MVFLGKGLYIFFLQIQCLLYVWDSLLVLCVTAVFAILFPLWCLLKTEILNIFALKLIDSSLI